MRVTSVSVHPVKTENSFVGYADVVFDDAFVVKGIKVKHRKDNSYVAIMPVRANSKNDASKKRKVNIFHPLNNDLRLEIEQAVAEAFNATNAPVEGA